MQSVLNPVNSSSATKLLHIPRTLTVFLFICGALGDAERLEMGAGVDGEL